jgi:hypothetical protein
MYKIDDKEEILKKLNDSNIEEEYSIILNEIKNIKNELKVPNLNHGENYTKDAITLISLNLFKGKYVSKSALQNALAEYLNVPGFDLQSGRHLSSQYGFYILSYNELNPDTKQSCPKGYYCLYSLTTISPKYSVLKRSKLNASSLDELKIQCGNKCMHCGSIEGKINFRNGSITKLTHGHIDPSLPPTIENSIPLCDYCNGTSKDRFVFQKNGAIHKVNYKSQTVAKKSVLEILKFHGKDFIINIIK